MSEFKDKLAAVRSNPALMIDVALNELDRQLNGNGEYDVPDASNPFVFNMECSTLSASMAVDHSEAVLRRLYPRMAVTQEELYLHMSDDDHVGRFATPVWTPTEIYLPYDEVLTKAVPYGDAGMRKLIIPRLTQVKVADHYFTMQYPIELRIMAHGGLQVVYNVDDLSPIQVLESNMVDWIDIRTSKIRLLKMTVPMGQFQVNTFQEALSSTSAYDASFSYSNLFYYARVYVSKAGGGWQEIRTTHTDQVFDPNVLTAVLKVLNGKLRVSIPVIYNTTGLLNGEIRVDVYTTRGKVDIDLGSYRDSQFELTLNDIDDDATYVAPVRTFSILQALNPHRVSGGAGMISFDDLRNMVIDNTLGNSKVPITSVQLENNLYTRGYTMVSNVDNITKRQFLASRRLSTPQNGSVIAGAGCVMAQLQVSMTQLATSQHVMDNGSRLTILPSMLYRYHDGKVVNVDDATNTRLNTSSAEAIARASVESRYLYTPFHYVLDASSNNFDVRPYYLDNPSIRSKAFVNENDTTQLQAGIDTYSIERIDTGYRIQVKLKSGTRFKEIADELVVVQLGYKPVGENNYASVNGVLVGKEGDERIYTFDINTRFDIDAQNRLYTTNMSMYDAVQTEFCLSLEHDFDISIVVNDSTTPGYVAGDMDLLVQAHLLSNEYMVVSRERLTVLLGYDITALWRRNRSIVSEESYLRYTADVPYYYEENVYERDEFGAIVITVNPDGSLAYSLLHTAGDPVLDADGNQVMKYLKGDVVLDANGQPTLIGGREIRRELTLFLVDGMYYFATEQSSVEYRNDIPMEIIGWLQNDVNLISRQLLDEAKLYLFPTTTFGNTVAKVREGLSSTVTVDQTLSITYYMTPTAYANSSIRPALIASTKEIVSEMLGRKTVVVSDIITRLKANAGEDILSIEATGLGGVNNFALLTVDDPAVRLSLRKKLTVLANQDLMVEDDIKINFLRHEATL
jgi:hypothetical protein